MNTCNRINWELCVLINEKTNINNNSKIKLEKSRAKYRSRYLISQ